VRLLVTNDDGIESVFLHELVRALLAADHEVFVVAPKVAERALGCPTWIVDGTPCDSVNIALDHLLPSRPDAVLSGINVGQNAGLAIVLGSGTVAGACEGAFHGLPAVALSQDLPIPVYDELKERAGVPDRQLMAVVADSAGHAARLALGLAAATPPGGFIVHNLNFPYPCPPETGLRRTVPAHLMLPGLFSAQAPDGTHRLVFKQGVDSSPDGPLTDRAALDAGFISHSVLDFSKLGSI
jgi:5'-nucleotidase